MTPRRAVAVLVFSDAVSNIISGRVIKRLQSSMGAQCLQLSSVIGAEEGEAGI
jgi:hypothetical protein